MSKKTATENGWLGVLAAVADGVGAWKLSRIRHWFETGVSTALRCEYHRPGQDLDSSMGVDFDQSACGCEKLFRRHLVSCSVKLCQDSTFGHS